MSVSPVVTRGFLFTSSMVVTVGYDAATVAPAIVVLRAGGDEDPGAYKKKKRKKRDEVPSDFSNTWVGGPAYKVPKPAPTEAPSEPVQEPVSNRIPYPVPKQVPRPLVTAMAGNAPIVLGRETRKVITELKHRLKMEMEDEEALLILGAFD